MEKDLRGTEIGGSCGGLQLRESVPLRITDRLRTIPLTDEAIRILENQRSKNKSLKLVPMEWKDIVFLCRKGTPVKNGTYDTGLFKYCDCVGISRFSMRLSG